MAQPVPSTDADDSNWEHFLNELQEEVGYFQYQVFGSQLGLSDKSEDTITIEVPREFHKEWLEDKQNGALREALNNTFDDSLDVKIKVCESQSTDTKSNGSKNGSRDNNSQDVNREFPFAKNNDFHPQHKFENFVVGDSNEYAYTAAQAVTDNPSNNFNPLYIYGGVGLGKTHLLHAIGHRIKSNWEQANVTCINAEQFTNQIISAIREGNTKDFKYRYRNVDMFLVDDVQFLSKTDAAQEEFFHTFNELYEKGKGTVFCSDCPPNEIPKIEERLRSRFGMGLIVDIKPPDYETRVAILQKKASIENLNIPEDVIHFLADNIHSNVRELESSLTRLSMKASLSNNAITPELAEEELEELLDRQGSTPTLVNLDDIQSEVAEHFNISVKDLTSKRRTRSIARPRQIAMYLCREHTDRSYADIGDEFGGRDHSTVIHAEKKVSDLLEDEQSDTNAHIHEIEQSLKFPN